MARRSDDGYYSTLRVEAYTDAVFAIAATLLVLDLTTKTFGKISSDQQLWDALWGMGENFMAFAVSFALLSLMWILHLEQWHDIDRVDGGLLWINNARLLFVVLIPFTTSLVSEYSEFAAGRVLLPINFFLATLLGTLSWIWAARDGGRLLKETAKSDIRAQNLGGLSAVICGAITVALAPFVGSWAFLAYGLNAPLTLLLNRSSMPSRKAP